MEIRKRSQKAVARRHDLNYFKKGSPIRHWQWKLALGAIAVGLLWSPSSRCRMAPNSSPKARSPHRMQSSARNAKPVTSI